MLSEGIVDRKKRMTTIIRRYSELKELKTFKERFDYLKLDGVIGKETFGFDRYLNQIFYRSPEWKHIRQHVILRDQGCDLGVEGYEIYDKIIIHHMNPVSADDIVNRADILLNPEYLISTVLNTHNAIHYSDESILSLLPIERTKNDTCPWKH
jgi:hypothetical protein